MAETKKKDPRLATPAGILSFPFITKPDTKFYALGEYRTKFAYDPNDPAWVAFIAKLTQLRDEGVAAAKKADPKIKNYTVRPVFEVELDKEGNPTGRHLIKASQKAVVESKTKGTLHFTIKIVDAKAKDWPAGGPPIYGGTKAKLSVDVRITSLASGKHIGIGLVLVGVQVLDLKTGTGGPTAESCGFGEEEGTSFDAPADTGTTDGDANTDGKTDF